MAVLFGDLKRQNTALRPEINASFAHVLDSGWYILGHEVAAFEQEFAAYCGASYCVGVASGAEALYLALAALEIGPGDEVITVANACMYQVAAIIQSGARPILVDIDPATGNIDAQVVTAAISARTKAIIPVHLYGRLADMPALTMIAAQYGIPVIEDAAQAHGAWKYDAEGHKRKAGAWGSLACFSFYPSKNLGALGDGGAVLTNDATLAERLRRLRMYGWDGKYNTVDKEGRNSRLDELQAATLRVKLRHLDDGNQARRERAEWYRSLLGDLPVTLPVDEQGHVYHLYVIASGKRNALRQHLLDVKIGCDVHYPVPAHLQPAYRNYGYSAGSLPHTEQQANCILSLPLYPELTRAEVEEVADAVRVAIN